MLLSVVLKVTTTFCEYDTKRRGRKQRKRSERTNGPQNKGRRENFLRFKKRELTVGIDQTTNVFFHPQTKENKRVLYLSTLSKRDLL